MLAFGKVHRKIELLGHEPQAPPNIRQLLKEVFAMVIDFELLSLSIRRQKALLLNELFDAR